MAVTRNEEEDELVAIDEEEVDEEEEEEDEVDGSLSAFLFFNTNVCDR